MVIIDIESNTSVGGLTLDPAGMHCPSWDDAFVSSCFALPQHRRSPQMNGLWLGLGPLGFGLGLGLYNLS